MSAPAGQVYVVRMGKRGTVVLPAPVRRRRGLSAGALIRVEEVDGKVCLEPVVAVSLEEARRHGLTEGGSPEAALDGG